MDWGGFNLEDEAGDLSFASGLSLDDTELLDYFLSADTTGNNDVGGNGSGSGSSGGRDGGEVPAFDAAGEPWLEPSGAPLTRTDSEQMISSFQSASLREANSEPVSSTRSQQLQNEPANSLSPAASSANAVVGATASAGVYVASSAAATDATTTKAKTSKRGGGGPSRKRAAGGEAKSTTAKAAQSSSPKIAVRKLTAEEKKARRLARNRESARQSRRRKKQYLELLEDKVEQLTNEVNELRRKRLEQAPKELHQYWVTRLMQLSQIAETLVQNPPPEQASAIRQALQQNLLNLRRNFGPNSPDYVRVMRHHFDLLKSVLVPPYTRFLLWAMDQGEDFFKSASNRSRGRAKNVPREGMGSGTASSLWPLVWNELGLTYEQEEKTKKAFLAMDNEANREARRQLVVSVELISMLSRVAVSHTNQLHDLTNKLCDVLTPEQQTLFFAWYEKNRRRLHESGLDRGIGQVVLRMAQKSGEESAALESISAAAAAIGSKRDDALLLNDALSFLKQLESALHLQPA